MLDSFYGSQNDTKPVMT